MVLLFLAISKTKWKPVVAFTGQFPSKCPLIYLFKVNMNKSEYIFELLDNSKMKVNLKLILLGDTIALYCITMRKDADILNLLELEFYI